MWHYECKCAAGAAGATGSAAAPAEERLDFRVSTNRLTAAVDLLSLATVVTVDPPPGEWH